MSDVAKAVAALKRYDWEDGGGMAECSDGDYLHVDDVLPIIAALLAERDQDNELMAQMANAIRHLHEWGRTGYSIDALEKYDSRMDGRGPPSTPATGRPRSR